MIFGYQTISRLLIYQGFFFFVFPALQGGPHNHQIGALAVQLKEVNTPEFKEYSAKVIQNSKALCENLAMLGHRLVSGGSDTHLCLLPSKHRRSYSIGRDFGEQYITTCSLQTVFSTWTARSTA